VGGFGGLGAMQMLATIADGPFIQESPGTIDRPRSADLERTILLLLLDPENQL
jgi:hypothetical protein